MARSPLVARRLFERFEPVHDVTYFAPEARAAMDGLGYRGYWAGYFAARSAPLGAVDPRVVEAIFYNFAPQRVAKALTNVWDVATPRQVLAARESAAVAALRRYGVSADADLRAAAELLGTAARSATLAGRPLFAALLSVPWPQDPVAALWHATTLLREQRGDAHVGVLVAAGISGRESNVLHAAAGRVARERIARTRDYDEDEWDAHVRALTARGLLRPDGSPTAEGTALKADIENRTDAASLPVLDVLSDDEVRTLFQTLTPITRQVIAGGDLPASTPMGLQHNDLHDDTVDLH